jgi:hypothetical protein
MELAAGLERCSKKVLYSKSRRGSEGDMRCPSRHARDFLCDPEICWCGGICCRPKADSVIATAAIDVIERLQR